MFWTCILHESRCHLERLLYAVNCSAVQTEFGESRAGTEASTKSRTAEDQNSGLRSRINSGVCYGRPQVSVRPSSRLKVAPGVRSAMFCLPDGLERFARSRNDDGVVNSSVIDIPRERSADVLQSALRTARENENRWVGMSPEFSFDSERMEQWTSTAKLRRLEVERIEALLANVTEPSGFPRPVSNEAVETTDRLGETG